MPSALRSALPSAHRAVLPLTALVATLGVSACAEEAPPASAPRGVVEQYATLDAEVAERGGTQRSGDWSVSYIVEAAEPWFEGHPNGHQQHRPPAAGETHHIEIIPRESSTGRVVPDVPVRLEVLDPSGKVVDAKTLNFYYSTFFHYANNFSIPAEGEYTLRATLEAPRFLRHGDSGEQPPLSSGATVTFKGVELGRE